MSHHMAVDEAGRPLALSPDQVKETVRRILDQGEILAAVVRMPDGNIAVQVFGPPSQDILGALETVTTAYRNVLRGM